MGSETLGFTLVSQFSMHPTPLFSMPFLNILTIPMSFLLFQIKISSIPVSPPPYTHTLFHIFAILLPIHSHVACPVLYWFCSCTHCVLFVASNYFIVAIEKSTLWCMSILLCLLLIVHSVDK